MFDELWICGILTELAVILINITCMSPGLLQFFCVLLLNNSPLCLCRSHKWTRSWTSSQTCCITLFPVSRGIRGTTGHLREATTTSVQSFISLTTPCPPMSSWQYQEETKTTYPDVVQLWVGSFLLFSSERDWVLRTWEKWSSSANQELCNCCVHTTSLKTCSSNVTHSSQRTVAKGLPGCLPPGKTSGTSTLILFLNKWLQLVISQEDQNGKDLELL